MLEVEHHRPDRVTLDSQTRRLLKLAVSNGRREQAGAMKPEPPWTAEDDAAAAVQHARLLAATAVGSTVNRPAHVERVVRMLATEPRRQCMRAYPRWL
jgi:hypothetical protein